MFAKKERDKLDTETNRIKDECQSELEQYEQEKETDLRQEKKRIDRELEQNWEIERKSHEADEHKST